MRKVSGWLWGLLPPLVAFVLALVATGIVILIAGGSPMDFYSTVLAVPSDRVLIIIINQAAMIALAGYAAAVGFRMGLFNIGVEGQYTIGACAGAFFAGSGLVAGPLNILATLIVAILAGALWASIAAILKVARGVSEVISSIMLNYIAIELVGYLVRTYGVREGYGYATNTIPPSSRPVGYSVLSGAPDVWALSSLALIVGVGYWFLMSRTRFGFDLRATGESASAAVASGVRSGRMVLLAMALSGAIAGLVWLPSFFGGTFKFGPPDHFQGMIGFTGLAVALLGRNRAAGILLGAVLFAYLSAQSNGLQRVGIAPQIIDITQGTVVLAVVIAYEVVRRTQARREQEAVSADLRAGKTKPEEVAS